MFATKIPAVRGFFYAANFNFNLYLMRARNEFLIQVLKWGGGAAFCLAWLVPSHIPPWSAFYNELLAVISLLLWGSWIFTSANRGRVLIPRSAIFIAGIALIPVMQFLSGHISFFGDALMASSYLALCAFGVVVGANLKRFGTKPLELLAWLYLIASITSVYLAANQWLGLTDLGIWLMDFPPNGRPYANLGQPNNLATLLCMGLAASIYLCERGKLGSLFLAAIVMILLIGIAMTRSRTSILAMSVLVAWAFWGRRQRVVNLSWQKLVVGFLMFAVLWTTWPEVIGGQYLLGEPGLARLQAVNSGDARLVLWRQLIDALWQKPLFGYGWNQVSTAQIALVAEYPVISPTSEYAHNVLIDLLIWNGIPLGLVIVVSIVGWFFVKAGDLKSVEHWFLLLLILMLIVHGMLEFPHAYSFFLLPAGVCIGLLCRVQKKIITSPQSIYGGFIIASLAVTAWISVEYHVIETDYRLMRFETAGIGQQSAHSKEPRVFLLTHQQQYIRLARTSAFVGMTANEIDWMKQVAHRYPYPPSLMRYVLALGLNNRPQSAALELLRLRRIQSVKDFDETRAFWPALVRRYPQLARVHFPRE
jgi:O-antigen ligase